MAAHNPNAFMLSYSLTLKRHEILLDITKLNKIRVKEFSSDFLNSTQFNSSGEERKKMNNDDLLSFKEYSPVHESHTHGGSAEINVNSPNRQRSPYHNATTTSNQSTTNDPIQDLLNSMSASVNVLQNEDRQRSPSSKSTHFIGINW